MAALRSVTSLTFYRHHVDTWDLRALHRLLPSLTGLTIVEYCPSQYVITSLRCLALDEFVLIRLFNDEAGNYGSTRSYRHSHIGKMLVMANAFRKSS